MKMNSVDPMGPGFRFDIGSILRDRVTGFQGVVLGRTEYATGCIQYGLQDRKLSKDTGAIRDLVWLDETRLTEKKR